MFSRPPRRSSQFRLSLEALEPRQMLTADIVFADPDAGIEESEGVTGLGVYPDGMV